MLMHTTGEPDILEVIADLSTDEVRTPPKIANAVLDLLPPDVWTDGSLRWLDPSTKTGVFLREVTKRLMVGLEASIPDPKARLDHILTNMVHGIAITELTSLISRRTVYCSKDAAGPLSTVQLPTSSGNVWLERVEHPYVEGRCGECGASEALMEHGGRDNHAYALIHEAGRQALRKDIDMQFDVIIGNPPYQMKSDGGSRDVPIYNRFVEQAKALNPRFMSLIIPSRWMAGGLGLNEFRNTMLADNRITRLVDYARMGDVFPGVDFEGGVCYFLWDRDNPGPCQTSHGLRCQAAAFWVCWFQVVASS
jgi:site-specific DNA-methyltransferase (adenine-specific)